MRSLTLACLVLVSTTAAAHQEFLLAPKLGVLLPYGFSSLGASYVVGVEAGWALPILAHRLAITLDGEFTAPEASGSATDPRLDASGGAYAWHLQQREVILGLSLVYRHRLGRLTPYAGVGPRLFLLDSRVDGTAGGATLSQSRELSTKVGAGIPVGVGYRLGPGDLFCELELVISALDHRITGDSNTGALSLALGYRVGF